MAMIRSLLASCVMVGSLAAAEPGFGKRHVLLFGIDGCRADALKIAVENGTAPSIKGLIETGTVTWTAFAGGETGQPSQQPTVSGPGWSSVLTGVWHDKHGVTNNKFSGQDYGKFPHFFERLHEVRPDAKLSSIVSWPPINDEIVKHSGTGDFCAIHTYPHDNPMEVEKALIAETIRTISTENPDVVFCYQGNTDHAGHTWGFSPEVPEYMVALQVVDERIGEVLKAVKARPDFKNENWLFVVATDHGGTKKNHGGQSPEERTIPLIVSGGDVPKGVVSKAVIGQVCVPATILRHLQVKIPAEWGWETRAFPQDVK